MAPTPMQALQEAIFPFPLGWEVRVVTVAALVMLLSMQMALSLRKAILPTAFLSNPSVVVVARVDRSPLTPQLMRQVPIRPLHLVQQLVLLGRVEQVAQGTTSQVLSLVELARLEMAPSAFLLNPSVVVVEPAAR